MNADKIILKQRTSTSYEVRFKEKNHLNEALILQINEVSEANMYKLIAKVYNLFINQKI